MDRNILHVYTDGSCVPNPRRGGYAVRLVYLNDKYEEEFIDFEFPGEPGATNNQMELRGCIEGIKEAMQFDLLNQMSSVKLITDSDYVVNNRYSAIYDWPKQNWVGKGGPVANIDLWKELVKNIKKIAALGGNLSFKCIKSHAKGSAKDIHNDAVDRLAKKAARSCPKPQPVATIRKRKFKKDNIREKVEACGQQFRIKIFVIEYLKNHKLFKIRYEVTSIKSKDYKKQGTVYYDKPLRSRNRYLVTIDKVGNTPMILNVHRTFERMPKSDGVR